MAGIPPIGGEPPIPTSGGQGDQAKQLAQATDEFVKKTYEILGSPHLADSAESLAAYAKTILDLHNLAQEALG